MANENQLNILKQGVDVWNQWRKKNPDIKPDLSYTYLIQADLKNANLTHANLFKAKLSHANLGHVRLGYANLSEADLSYADLSEARLGKARLSHANLSYANLNHAHFGSADLSHVNLSYANLNYSMLNYAILYKAILNKATLSYADLSQTDLRNTNLIEADLFKANLSYANLYAAYLSYVNFRDTNLHNANLTDTQIGWTVFVKNDLSQVKGLETVKHLGPSSIGIDTIIQSQGKIPEVFLQGAGVPDFFITYMKSLTGGAFKYYSCFISYANKDKAFAERLHADLQAKAVGCWYAPEDLTIGEPFILGIDKGIQLHDKLLLVLSEHSVASGWVQHEVLSAFAKEQGKEPWVLFPVRLDDAALHTNVPWANMIKQSRHIGDFTQWKDNDAYQQAFERLLRDLKTTTEMEVIISTETTEATKKSFITPDILNHWISEVTQKLNEPNHTLIRQIVTTIGVERTEALLQQTLDIEANGGQMSRDNTRRKTPGGIFISLARAQAANGKERKKMLDYRKQTKPVQKKPLT